MKIDLSTRISTKILRDMVFWNTLQKHYPKILCTANSLYEIVISSVNYYNFIM